MGALYLVIYEGEPDDPKEFVRFYTKEHLPVMRTLPGIRGVELELGTAAKDPLSEDAGIFMIARFRFDTLSDLRSALRSKARQRARADMRRFPRFRGIVRHQAVETKEVVGDDL